MQKSTTRKKIKTVEKNMIGIKVEKKKYLKQHVNSRLQILLRKEYQCSILHVQKKNMKKKKIDRIKIKNFSIFNKKKLK